MKLKDLEAKLGIANMGEEDKLALVKDIQANLPALKAEQRVLEAKTQANLVVEAIKKIKEGLEARFDELNGIVDAKVRDVTSGKDGIDGKDGKNGVDGKDGKDGLSITGPKGADGEAGQDGVGVQDAHIDFDGSLIITLTNGKELNVGEVVPFDVAEKIKVIGNGGGTSQSVLDSIAALTTAITTNVAITGGTINGTTVGATTPAAGKFTTLESTGTASLGTTSAQYMQVVGDANYPALKAAGSGTNIPAVVQPKGTGALQAQQTDSTATGGNARGANAVDWQTSRGSASNVASGQYGVIGGGYSNTASSFGSVISGGYINSNSGFLASITGGQQNTASKDMVAVGGGQFNTGAGFFNYIGGGYTNSGTSGSVVTTQSGTMNGTTAVTLSGSNASIKVGQLITGTSIASYTYVAAISGTSLTLSQAASGSSTSTLSFYTPHGVVVGGGNNQATGSYSFIGGGGDAGTAANRNVASGAWSAVVGGIKNTASGAGSVIGGGGTDGSSIFANTASGATSVIVGGWNSVASGALSFIGGGTSHTVSGDQSTVAGGQGNTASGLGSSVLGGYNNTANSTVGTVIGGRNGISRSITGYISLSGSNNPIANSLGVSQAALLILARQTTDATATVLTSDSNAAGTANQIILPNNSAYYFKGTVVAGVTGGGNTKGWTVEGVIKRGANAASTAIVGTATVVSAYADAGAATWALTATADTTNGGLAITFTGQAGTTIRAVAQITTTEMTY